MRNVLVGTIIVSLLLAPLATADNLCPGEDADATIETPTGTYYLVLGDCMPESCFASVWVFEESNGHPGLQRDESACESDTAFF